MQDHFPASVILERTILDNLATSVLLLDRDLKVSYINPAGEQLFELSARQVQGMPFREFLSADTSDGSELEQSMRKLLETGHPFTERERELRLPGQRSMTLDCTVTPLGEGREILAMLVELRQVDQHLRVTREQRLIAQHQATRALLRGLAHEIKNPLGGLRGAAQLLERELNAEELKEYTRIIIGEADRLLNLLNRMIGCYGTPNKRPLNIHEVLEHVCSLVQAETAEGIRILRDYDPSLPCLLGDRDQLIQALLNIVRNAVQAVGEKGEITLRSRAERQFTIGKRRYKLVARIDVMDDGPGIPWEMMQRIFYPMVTSKAKGSGLGLSIAQQLANLHNGLIECASRPGCTVFTLLLPLEGSNG
jgi:PAS domain S-box